MQGKNIDINNKNFVPDVKFKSLAYYSDNQAQLMEMSLSIGQ